MAPRPYIIDRNKQIRKLRYRKKNPMAPKDIVDYLGLTSVSVVYNACRRPSRRGGR